MIPLVQKYASIALLAVVFVFGAALAYLWHGKGVQEAVVKDLTAKNSQLSTDLQAEKDWSAKLSAELAKRQQKQKQSNGQKKAAEDKLDKSYAENPEWSGAPVPDSTADSLREFLSTR